MGDEKQNGWNEWSRVVLNELERLTESTNQLTKEFQSFKVEVAKEIASKKEVETIRRELEEVQLKHAVQISKLETELKLKAGLWGAVGSGIGVLIMIAIAMLT